MSVQAAKSAPQPIVLEGSYVRLEPLERRHAADLLAAAQGEGVPERFAWLFEYAPATLAEAESFTERMNAGPDRFVAVVDRRTGKAHGRQGWMRIFPEHASIEIGGVYWGPGMARTPLATEALYLFARHAFDDLGYRSRIVDRRNKATLIVLLTKLNRLIVMLVPEGISNARKIYPQHIGRATTVCSSFDRVRRVLKKHHGARDSQNRFPHVSSMVARVVQYSTKIFLEGIHLNHSACHTITSFEKDRDE